MQNVDAMQCVVNLKVMQNSLVTTDGGPRKDQLVVRVTLTEKRTVKKAALKARRKASEWTRIALLDRAADEAAGKAPPPRPLEPDETSILEAFRKLERDPSLRSSVLALCYAVSEDPRLAGVLRALAVYVGGEGGTAPTREGTARPR